MGWRPTVGVLLPYVGGCYYTPLLAGVQRGARRRGARVVAFQTAGMEFCWPAEVDTDPLGWNRIDAWIGISDAEATGYYQRIAAAGKPLVTVSTRLPGHNCCAVLPDNYRGVNDAVGHLLEHGHRRIAFAGALTHIDIRERYDAYVAALHAAGITPDSSLFFSCAGLLEQDGRIVGAQLAAARLPCSAIVAGSDALAVGIVDVLRAAGYRVPQDLAIAGFDNIERAQYTDPPLTTVHLPFDVLAERATEVLLAKLLDGTALPELIRVAGTLIRRHSCGCSLRQRPSLPPEDALRREIGRERFTHSLLEVASGGRTLDAALTAEIRPHAAKLAAHLLATIHGESAMSPTEVRDAWQRLLTVAHDVETVEALVSLVEDAASVWLRATNPDGNAEESVQLALRSLRFELMRAWAVAEQTRRRYADSNADANRQINLALIGVDLSKTPALSWLRWTRLRHAVFGEWRAPTTTAPRRLCIRSVFHAGPEPMKLVGSEHVPAEFPSPELCDLIDADEAVLMNVVPIAGRGKIRGILAVVGPIEIELTENTGNLELWAALLGAAMDREELMASQRLAFEREREFAETLRQSEERYALAAHGANDGLWDWDVVSGRVYLSARWKSMLGHEDAEIAPHVDAWFSRVHENDLPGLKEALEARVGSRKTHIQHEYRMVHKDGRHVWVLCRGIVLFDDRGNPVRVAGSQTDITASKEAEEQLRRNALHDALTGLPNRALLMDRLEQSIARAQRTADARFAVLFLDLDHFKTLNDSLGHLAGDQLLVQIAHRLGECLRSTDTVARLGGDEFAIILADLENDEAPSIIAERIQEALGEPFELEGHRVFTSASVGITLSSEKYKRAADFLRDADTAMYRAKSQGRARHQLFDGHMHEQAMERLSVEAGMRRALERDELVLYYQPIVSLETGAIGGVEALIRWNHPERGLLMPADFLAVAEESGLIVPISEWVLRSACEQAAQWKHLQPMRISVNMPPQQLRHPSFVKLISDHLHRSALAPSAIGLELVESSLIENREAIVENLQQLRAMGVYIAVDDFGTGYSSLSYLKRLPIDALKIDRSFTQGIPSDINDTAISTTIIAMARSLNLHVVAEGVETPEQADFLRAQGCHTAQGYLFSRPLPAAECLPFLELGARVPLLASRLPPRDSSRLRLSGTK